MTASEKYPFLNQDCFKVDLNLKKILEEITQLNQQGDLSSDYLKSLHGQKIGNQAYFNSKNCQGVIEFKKLNETAELITNNAVEQEKRIIGQSNKEQKIYIGLGSVTLLVMLIILLRK